MLFQCISHWFIQFPGFISVPLTLLGDEICSVYISINIINILQISGRWII